MKICVIRGQTTRGKMELSVLGSGSRGNAAILHHDETKILLDSGFSLKEISDRIEAAGYSPNEIDAIVTTHHHSDHINSATMLGRKYDIPVYCSKSAKSYLFKRARGGYNNINVFNGKFSIKQLELTAIPVPHDAEGTVAFYINANGYSMTLATDLGTVPEELTTYLKKSQVWVLESNHDPEMLKYGPYPEDLKTRVASDYGHLSNFQALKTIKNYSNSDTEAIVFAHLSAENNSPGIVNQLIEEQLQNTNSTKYLIASQGSILSKIQW